MPAEHTGMGVAYFIVLDKKKRGLDTSVNGRAVDREREAIGKITKKLKLSDIESSTSFARMAAQFGADPMSEGAKEKWFEATEGLRWVDALYEYIDTHKRGIGQRAAVLEDLEEYKAVLTKAQAIKAKWHFEMDV
jgi:hypothetical protein